MKVLVTGGLGYIGSHTCCELLDNNYEVVVIDNLSNSKEDVIDKIKKITNKDLKFYKGDLCDKELVDNIFKNENIDAVIHFAGLKAVGESVKKPLLYYRNNLDSTLTLLEVMCKYNCKKLVFSSSATVYGNPKTLPIKEDFPLQTTNPYGSTKLYIEGILKKVEPIKATVYMTFPGSKDWTDRVFSGIIEASGRDHIILSHPENGTFTLLPNIYVDFIEFDEDIKKYIRNENV